VYDQTYRGDYVGGHFLVVPNLERWNDGQELPKRVAFLNVPGQPRKEDSMSPKTKAAIETLNAIASSPARIIRTSDYDAAWRKKNLSEAGASLKRARRLIESARKSTST
jgi:hypothetical protein